MKVVAPAFYDNKEGIIGIPFKKYSSFQDNIQPITLTRWRSVHQLIGRKGHFVAL
ncbi:hypothetical protein [Sinomicrobium sp. M5D2P9]